jgi:xylulose-5-phosphate/fructose-6-phosphate phosphoketolase
MTASTLPHPAAPGDAAIVCHRAATSATYDDLAYASAASYLTVAQLYLRANPLLREPLQPEDLKPRPAGSWRHCAAVNLIYAQLNRMVRETPVHAQLTLAPLAAVPAVLANLWLDGTAGGRAPALRRDLVGLRELVRTYQGPASAPAALGAHLPPLTRLSPARAAARAVLAACGAAFGRPEVVSFCVLAGAQAAAGFSERVPPAFAALRPGRDGLVVPVVEVSALSGAQGEAAALVSARGFTPLVVSEPEPCMAHAALGDALGRIVAAREEGRGGLAIVFVTPPALSAPALEDARAQHPASGAVGPAGESLFLPRARADARQRAALEEWLLGYEPDALFAPSGAPSARLDALVPPPERRVGELDGPVTS